MALFLTYLLCIFLLSFGMTRFVLWYAEHRRFLDIPNDRSSHTEPTPRGGGIGIVFAFFGAVGFLAYRDMISVAMMWALFGGGLLVAVVGFLDDCYHIRVRYRIIVHTIVAGGVLYWLGGFPTLDIGFMQLTLGWVGSILALLAIVWMSNLYNFMDGIDGLAGSEAVFVGLAGGLLSASYGAGGIAFVSFALAASAAGFLWWNWHPARIFMGDVGSTFIGFSLSVLALFGERSHGVPALSWVIVLMPFLVDATFTTIRRMWKGERWFEAHRTFSYQKVVVLGSSHSRVTLQVILLSTPFFFLAFFAGAEPRLLIPVVGIAFVFFSWLWWKIQRPRVV